MKIWKNMLILTKIYCVIVKAPSLRLTLKLVLEHFKDLGSYYSPLAFFTRKAKMSFHVI